ncbi:major core protein [Acrididae reovirus]|nr:major core protein [Acrididae reovirus]
MAEGKNIRPDLKQKYLPLRKSRISERKSDESADDESSNVVHETSKKTNSDSKREGKQVGIQSFKKRNSAEEEEQMSRNKSKVDKLKDQGSDDDSMDVRDGKEKGRRKSIDNNDDDDNKKWKDKMRQYSAGLSKNAMYKKDEDERDSGDEKSSENGNRRSEKEKRKSNQCNKSNKDDVDDEDVETNESVLTSEEVEQKLKSLTPDEIGKAIQAYFSKSRQKNPNQTTNQGDLSGNAAVSVLISSIFGLQKVRLLDNADEVLRQGLLISEFTPRFMVDDYIQLYGWRFINTEEEGIPSLFTLISQKYSTPSEWSMYQSDREFKHVAVRKALDMFDFNTLVSYVVPTYKYGKSPIDKINDQLSNHILVFNTVIGATDVEHVRLNYLLANFLSALKAYSGIKDTIITTPSKEVTTHENIPFDCQLLFANNMAQGDGPHIYFAAVALDPSYYRTDIVRAIDAHPIQLGEHNTQTDIHHRKISAEFDVVTDQFTAFLSRIWDQKFEATTMIAAEAFELMKACLMRDVTRIDLQTDPNAKTNYNVPSRLALDSFTFYSMVDPEVSLKICTTYRDILIRSNRLRWSNAVDLWNNAITPQGNLQLEMFEAIKRTTAINLTDNVCDLLLFEAYPDSFDITLSEIPSATAGGHAISIICLSCFALFPRLLSRIRKRLGILIMQHLKDFVGLISMSEYTENNGYFKRRVGAHWEIADFQDFFVVDEKKYTDLVPSIYTPIINPAQPSQKWNRLRRLIQSIQNILEIRLYPEELEIKRNANLPYSHQDYQVNYSWPDVNMDQLRHNIQTDQSTLLLRIATLVTNLYEFSIANENPRVIRTSASTYIQSIGDRMIEASKDLPCLFYTCRKLEEYIFNAPLFTHDQTRFRDNNGEYRTIALGAERIDNDQNAQGLTAPIKRIPAKMDVAMPFNFLLRAVGDVERRVSYQALQSTRRIDEDMVFLSDISPPHPKILLEKWLMIVNATLRMCTADTILYYIFRPAAPNNLCREEAQALQPVMNNRNSRSIAQKVYEQLLTGNIPYLRERWINSGYYDERYLVNRIVYQDPMTNREVPDPGENNIMYQNVIGLEEPDREVLSVLMYLYLDNQSPIVNQTTGIRIGKLIVDERTPFIPHEEVMEQFPMEVNLENIRFSYHMTYHGSEMIVTVNGIDYSSSLSLPKMNIICQNLSQIRSDFIDFIEGGIQNGNVMLTITDKAVWYHLSYEPHRNQNYNEAYKPNTLKTYCNQPDSQPLDILFPVTTYATSYVSGSIVITKHIQYHTLIHPPKELILTAGVLPQNQPFNSYRPLNPHNWEFGEMRGAHSFLSDGRNKLTAPVVNFNNRIYTKTRARFDNEIAILVSYQAGILRNVA